ncbi:UNVERIFIED_CONTAM: hypothetical protein PYX00_009121 [Menopon gallinae]|uniref:NUC153 domain-containing protein n=1 Tax=Menopon gallinae TaxID=328185 RepID=A0AAW2HAD6_9NEOP
MGGDMDEVTKDPRFAHIVKDARFRRLPKKHVKVTVDKRFQSMFTDKKFQIKCHVDKRGRPLDIGASEDLKRYYDLSDSDEESEDSENKEDNVKESAEDDDGVENEEEEENDDDDIDKEEKVDESSDAESGNEKDDSESKSKKGEKKLKKGGESHDSKVEKSVDEIKDSGKLKKNQKDKKLLTAEIKRKLRNKKIDYARGEGKLLSESSSEEESEAEESDYEEHDWGELDNDAETTEEATNRLAICNMDWDRIKAVDLMVLFHSFLPAGGLIHSVTIYPSDFGMQRMKEEEENGPIELKELKTENEDEEMDREHMEKLRKYQLNRLKYYYAIMVCDTKETANSLYKECDGLEYECSAVKLDLRFVPDDTTFDQEPKDTCTSLPDLSTYRPRLFQTTALTRSKVELTWDENDPDREELVRSVHSGNIDEDKLKEYLAYSSSEDDDYEDAKILINDAAGKPETEQSSIDKYKSLLADIESNEAKKKNNEVNLEVTWNLKLENKANEMVKEKLKDKDNMTPFEQYIDKKREKKKKKKQERLTQIEEQKKGSDESAFSDDDIPSDVDLDDPYFKEELDQMKTKKKKKKSRKVEEPETEEQKQKKAELELLMLDDNQDKHFSLKKIEESENTSKKKFKKGKKRKAEPEVPVDDFKIDVNDERFSALYTSHHFNIDPTDPQYKPTKATKELIEEKLRRRREMDERGGKSQKLAENGKHKNTELNVLVKNIKKNTAELRRVN